MPRYVFECHTCNVQFERTLKIGSYTEHECPSCHETAPRVIKGFGFAFASGGSAPGNSGVHDHDYPTADKAVGRSAAERHAVLDERDKVKTEARKRAGTTALIRRNGPGYVEYEPMSAHGLEAHKRLTRRAIELSRQSKER